MLWQENAIAGHANGNGRRINTTWTEKANVSGVESFVNFMDIKEGK